MAVLEQSEFKRLQQFVHDHVGIKMPPSKQKMLEARLLKRLRLLKFHTFPDYFDFAFSRKGKEKEFHYLIDSVTTHKTEFFREPEHFRFLQQSALPHIFNKTRVNTITPCKIWCAASSSGEEPYTIAMTASDFLLANDLPLDHCEIIASDISVPMLRQVKRAIYSEESANTIPVFQRNKYVMSSKDRSTELVRMVPEIRQMITLKQINLTHSFHFEIPYQIIFLRNVLIYFEKDKQEQIIRRMCDNLILGGYLFLGHAEGLVGVDLPLTPVSPTVYQKRL